MKKLIFQSLLTIAGVSLSILPIAPVKSIADPNSTPSRIDRHLQNAHSGLGAVAAEQQSDDRSGLLSKTLIAQRKPKPPKPDDDNSKKSKKNPSQNPNASNVPVAGVYPNLGKSPEYRNFSRQGFRMAKNGLKKDPIKNTELRTELRKISQNQWRKVYMDGYIRNKNVRNDYTKVSIHYFENAVTRQVYDVKIKEGWSVLKVLRDFDLRGI